MNLDKINGIIVEKITRAIILKRIEELPTGEKVHAREYPKNVRLYDEIRRRLGLSGNVKTVPLRWF